jgi:hypothetical protein
MGTISGTVHLRPARVGLVTCSATEAAVRQASALSCSAWGGMYYPILIARDPELRRTTELLAIDFWHALDNEPETQDLSDTPGLCWRGRDSYGPFAAPDESSITMRLLPTDRQQFVDPRARVLPVWEADDPEGARQLAVYRETASAVELPSGGEFPDLGDVTTPVTATGAGLTYTGDSPGATLVLIGDDPEDLARLWNLRAWGGVVFPWPVGDADRFESAVRAWLRHPTTAAAAHSYQRGDGEHGRYITMSAGALDVHVQRPVRLIEEEGWRAIPHDYPTWGGWTGHHPVQTDEERDFTIPVGRDDRRMDLPLPQPPRAAGRRQHWPGIVVADITVHREEALPSGRLFAIPAIRKLAPLLDEVSQELHRFQRPTGEGRAVAVQAAAERHDRTGPHGVSLRAHL